MVQLATHLEYEAWLAVSKLQICGVYYYVEYYRQLYLYTYISKNRKGAVH